MFYLGKLLLSPQTAETFGHEIATYVNAAYGNLKKCIVTDLDNTLWGGVIGEDGPEGIVLGDDSPIGSIYSDIQRILLSYKQRGILLAISSKNNVEDVLPVFANKNMVLQQEDFISMKINWRPKSENVREIADELNLGVDSFVFVDDNPAERLEVGARLPGVHVIEVPQDIAKLPSLLRAVPFLKAASLTDEDGRRHELYLQERKRTELAKKLPMELYLSHLGIGIEVRENDTTSLERITQLVNKTNQFNARTQRHTQEEVRMLMVDKGVSVFSLRTWDKFGDLGIVAVAIVKRTGDSCFLDTFLMSCRVLSRGIEQQFFTEIIRRLNGCTEIRAEYLWTPKNSLVREFFESVGCECESETDKKKTYRLDLRAHAPRDVPWIVVPT
jgi:FkbH-like protein